MHKYIKIIIFNIILSPLIFNNAIALSSTASQKNEPALSSKNLQRLTTIINNIKKYYYKPVDEDALFDKAISGMLSGLDPHSEYLKPEDLKELKMAAYGKFGGIGVEVIPYHGAIKVISPLDDTPAYRAGIKAGDYIIQINDKFVRDMTLDEAINIMRGEKGSKIKVTILRKNASKPLVLKMRREMIKIESVKDSKLIEPSYGYIRLAIFQEQTEKDMIKAINKLKKLAKGRLQGLILDLRNNPGGLFDSAAQVADDFLDAKKLKDNDLIVYTKGQDKESQIAVAASDGELLPDVPIAVLINEGSASAAEIVAGALQDHKRAIVVGTRSFGKGSTQLLIPADKNSAIKLTTAIYYTPLGRSIQAKGIKPDINVEDISIPLNHEEQVLPRVDESSLIDHIQDGDEEEGDDMNEDQKLGDLQDKSKAELELLHTDRQAYEALQSLKSLNAMKHE